MDEESYLADPKQCDLRADDSVSFYAIGRDKGPELKRNLQEFEGRLPSGVTVKYYY